MEAAELQARWRALDQPAGARLNAERIQDWAGGPVLVAVDAGGTRHLLIRVDDSTHVRAPRPVAGLTVSVRRLRTPGHDENLTWLDLSSQDPYGTRAFAGLCADVLDDMPASGPPSPEAALAVIARWRRFWSPSHEGLSADEQLGLFGELWLLLRWVQPLTLAALASWRGPLGGRHDFVTTAKSVEVKVTKVSTGPIVHRINGIDQLAEPGSGRLHLLSLRAVADPLGEHSLDLLIDEALTITRDMGPAAAGALDDRLTAAGWSDSDAGRYSETLRVTTQELFLVDDDFPRLTIRSFPDGLPAGISDISYTLDTSACRRWRIAVGPQPDGSLASLVGDGT